MSKFFAKERSDDESDGSNEKEKSEKSLELKKTQKKKR